jgi:hypothetical protein
VASTNDLGHVEILTINGLPRMMLSKAEGERLVRLPLSDIIRTSMWTNSRDVMLLPRHTVSKTERELFNQAKVLGNMGALKPARSGTRRSKFNCAIPTINVNDSILLACCKDKNASAIA